MQTNASKFADDLHELSRMPITALRITSEAEAANLRRKTILFMFLDTLIIINTVLFIIIAPIEQGNKTVEDYCLKVSVTQCNLTRYVIWCSFALPLSCLSLTMDALTLCQIRRKYVNAVTALAGFAIDTTQLGMAIGLWISVVQGVQE